MKKSKEIDLNKKYNFPLNLDVVHHRNKILVIARDVANWIVLENEEQLMFFSLLQQFSIGESFANFTGKKEDAVSVLIQIEAKKFDSEKIRKTSTTSLFIYLTTACNMSCPHCYMYAGEKKDNELSFSEINTVLTEYKKYGGKRVCFSGGEICMHPDLVKLIDRAYELNYKIILLTNGTLWTEEMIEAVYNKIDSIQISIDGFNEEENSKIRGVGSFEKALKSVDLFYKKGVKVKVAITPIYDDALTSKAEQFGKFGKELLKKYNEKNFSLVFSTDLMDGRDIHLSEEDKKNYAKIITEKIYPICYGNDGEQKPFISFFKSREIRDVCSYGNLNISSNGDVAFCSGIINTHPVANIRRDNFSDLLNLREKARRLANVNNLTPCKNCELKYICGGGCRTVFFKSLIESDIRNVHENTSFERRCTITDKKHFYDLMIDTNENLFK